MRLSVVIPVYNARDHIAQTIDAAVTAIANAGDIEAELVLVDDGSTDESGAVGERAVANRLPFRLISQPNRGRFEARRVGIEAARGKWILLLDSRFTLRPDALRFVLDRVAVGDCVWTSHVDIPVDGNPYAAFWMLIAELAWADYFSAPRTTSFGSKDFDRFPKGTTCFFAPRAVLLDAIAAFRSGYSDLRYANDDTPLIRWIAEREPIHVSPEFRGSYAARTTLQSFVRHAFHRGIVFLDGHGRRESRFSAAVLAFYPASAMLVASALRRPSIVPVAAGLVGSAAAALGIARRRTPFEVATLAVLTPVYGAAHAAGMWRGLALKLLR